MLKFFYSLYEEIYKNKVFLCNSVILSLRIQLKEVYIAYNRIKSGTPSLFHDYIVIFLNIFFPQRINSNAESWFVKKYFRNKNNTNPKNK